MTETTPRISIVIPTLDGGATLGDALQSLLDTAYPALEILVVDGGSTDNSREVIDRFAKQITWWVSEPDRGQAHAINKGLARATGEIVNWLGSDDLLRPHSLQRVAAVFAADPRLDVVAGACQVVDLERGTESRVIRPSPEHLTRLPPGGGIPQPSCFVRRRALRRTPAIDERYDFAMDNELFNYLKASGARWRFVDDVFSIFRESAHNKTSRGGVRIIRERERIYRTYTREWIPLTLWHRLLRHPLHRLRHRLGPGTVHQQIERVDARVARALGIFYDPTRVQAMDWSAFLD